jgi:type IV pilus assembly protein PilE
MKQQRGFTLIELMIVLVVAAVLAAIALPSYTDYVRRSKLAEAHANLADLRVKLEQFYQDNRNYGSTAATCGAGVPATQMRYFSYSCNWGAGGTNQFYTVTAAGLAAQGLEGLSFTITESNVKATTVTGGSAMEGYGYTGNANCWVTKMGGLC